MKRKNIQNSNGISVCDSIVMSVKNKRTNLRKPFSVFIALVGYFSVILAFFGMFKINCDHGRILTASCIFAGFYIILTVIEKKALWVFTGSLFVFVFAIYKKLDDIVRGFEYVYNIIYSCSYRTEIQYYKGLRPSLEVSSATTMIIFYIWLLAIVVFFFTICRPNPILPLLVTFPVLEVGLYNGVELPVIRGMLVVAYWLALLGMCTIDIGEYSGGQSGFVRKNNLFFPKRHMKLKVTEKCGAFIMAVVMLVTFVSTGILKLIDYKRSDELNRKRRDLTEAASNFSIDNIAESIADFSNALGFEFKYENHRLGTNDHISYKNVTDLKVTVSSKPESAIYIRDYSGSDYHDNEWFDLPDSSYNDLRYKNCENYGINPQDFPAVFAPIISSETLVNRISIKSQLKGKKVFTPYGTLDTGNFKYDYDKMLAVNNNSATAMVYDFFPMNAEMILNKMGGVARGTYSTSMITDEKWRDLISSYCSENNLISFDDFFSIDHEVVAPDQFLYDNGMMLMSELLENNYRGFVYDNYLKVPDTDAMREVRKVYADVIGSGTYTTAQQKLEVLENIRGKINDESEYSLHPGKTPSNRDFVNYFLLENHKGFCIHYATSGVILARMAGIPARYATGYVVVGDDFNNDSKNNDGTFTIDVKDNRNHAWAEVYIDGFGWMPFEFTAGYTNTSVHPEAPVTTTTQTNATTTSTITTSHKLTRSTTKSIRTTGSGHATTTAQTTTSTESGPLGIGSGKGKIPSVLVNIFKIIVASALLVGFVLFRRYAILRIRNNRFNGGSSHERISYIYAYTESLLKKLSLDNDDGKFIEFAKIVEERIGEIYFDKDGFNEMTQVALRSRFGNIKPEKAELEKCRSTAEKLASSIYRKRNHFERFYMKYIDVLI